MIQNKRPEVAVLRPLLHGAAAVLAGLLLPFVWLREQPEFWTYAGGYPLWLRQAVLLGFYPLLLAQGVLITFLSCLLVRSPSRFARLVYAEAVVLLLHWAVLALVVLMMLANNVANLLDGRPLHDHQRSVAASGANFKARS